MDREREYLKKFDYGNADPTSGLTTFWLGGSLQISPDERVALYAPLIRRRASGQPAAMRTVRQLIVQPQGAVTTPLASTRSPPLAAGTIVSAKTEAAPIGR